MKFLKSISLTFVTQITTIIIGLISGVIIARYLGPTGKGVFTLLSVLTSVVVIFGNIGFPAAQIYFLGRRSELLPGITGISIWFGFIGGSIITLLAYLGIRFFPDIIIKGIEPLLALIIILTLPFYFTTQFIRNILLGCQKILPYNLIDLIIQVLFLIVAALVLIIMRMDIRHLIISWALIGVVGTFAYILYLNKLCPVTFSFDFKLFYEMISYGIKSYVSSLLGFLILRFDTFIVNYYLGNDGAGIYSIAVALGNLIYIFPGVVGILLFPMVASGNSSGEFTQKVIRHTIFITFILGCTTILLAKWLILFLYGDRFSGAVIPFYWLLPGILFLSISSLLMQDLAGRGLPPIVYIAPAIALALNVVANMVLIPRYGISGASISSTIAYFLMMVMALREFNKITKTPFLNTFFLRQGEIKEMVLKGLNYAGISTR